MNEATNFGSLDRFTTEGKNRAEERRTARFSEREYPSGTLGEYLSKIVKEARTNAERYEEEVRGLSEQELKHQNWRNFTREYDWTDYIIEQLAQRLDALDSQPLEKAMSKKWEIALAHLENDYDSGGKHSRRETLEKILQEISKLEQLDTAL